MSRRVALVNSPLLVDLFLFRLDLIQYIILFVIAALKIRNFSVIMRINHIERIHLPFQTGFDGFCLMLLVFQCLQALFQIGSIYTGVSSTSTTKVAEKVGILPFCRAILV